MKTAERTRIVIDGIVVTLVPRDWRGDRRTYYSKSRVYGAVEALAADLNSLEPEWVPEPVGVEADDVTRLKGKIWRAWRDGTKAIVAQRLSELMEKLTDSLPDYTVRFSYKAGCSCGCSPGFILSGKVRDDGEPADIFLSREEEE